MRLYVAIIVAGLLSHSPLGRAEDNTTASRTKAALARLKAECDVPGQTNASLWTSYISATEKARHEAIGQLQTLGSGVVPLVRAEFQQATNEYREMLTVALAALRNDAAILEGADLMLTSKRPAVRVGAAMELRGIKDKRTLGHFKKALQDPFEREDGGCVRIGDGMIYPVRIIASDALVGLGVPVDEVRKLRGNIRH